MLNFQSFYNMLTKVPGQGHVQIPEFQNYKISVPEEGDREEVLRDDPSFSDLSISGLLVGIEYTDVYGDVTRRKITCREIQETQIGHWLIKAFCHERKATRRFRVDRIGELVALSTGEVFENGFAFLKSLAKEGIISGKYTEDVSDCKDQKKVHDYLRPAIKILVYIARCDGHFHEDELQVIAGFIECVRPAGQYNYNLAALLRYAARQYPESYDYSKCVERVFMDGSWCEKLRGPLLKYIPKLIYADGILETNEFELACEIEGIAEQAEQDRMLDFLDMNNPPEDLSKIHIDDILSGKWQ